MQDVSTLKEPYRAKGKKTIGFEIVEQLNWTMPDVIVYPTGGGVGLIGIHKALTELSALGWIKGKLPRLVAVQSTGCAPIVRAYQEGAGDSQAWPEPFTLAFGINVPKALGDFLILQAVRETDGIAIAVDDEAILSAQRDLAALESSVRRAPLRSPRSGRCEPTAGFVARSRWWRSTPHPAADTRTCCDGRDEPDPTAPIPA